MADDDVEEISAADFYKHGYGLPQAETTSGCSLIFFFSVRKYLSLEVGRYTYVSVKSQIPRREVKT